MLQFSVFSDLWYVRFPFISIILPSAGPIPSPFDIRNFSIVLRRREIISRDFCGKGDVWEEIEIRPC